MALLGQMAGWIGGIIEYAVHEQRLQAEAAERAISLMATEAGLPE